VCDGGQATVDQLMQGSRDVNAVAMIVQVFGHYLGKGKAGQARNGSGQPRPPANAQARRKQATATHHNRRRHNYRHRCRKSCRRCPTMRMKT